MAAAKSRTMNHMRPMSAGHAEKKSTAASAFTKVSQRVGVGLRNRLALAIR